MPRTYLQHSFSGRHKKSMEPDPFDGLLDLEEEYYQEGYALGVADGSKAGRIEGRIFGLEKGFEKFAAMGALHGKAALWAARLQQMQQLRALEDSSAGHEQVEKSKKSLAEVSQETTQETAVTLPLLSSNPRLEKHIQTLFALAEPASLSTQNTEDAVSDFDDRLKRATAKAKVIEKIVGEGSVESALEGTDASSNGTPEKRSIRLAQNEKSESNMEDFGASPHRARS
ncbi:hypothetical protein H2199_004715 [Coniosporium tulheliwenetii]|uniref:Uncharacterized protein n=1 Tax=Coniosporium tulheliwenetii TaxID=3383036 RepID=A0ACC2Z401_9PEZI|nr:hypothetical protein H2199_004715 [Cladosporium sp. JES 115]